MIEFQLFRIKVFPSIQKHLFNAQLKPSELLKETIKSKPEGGNWHLGDVEKLDESGYFFRFGRTTKATLEMFHNGHFEDAEYETTPYTHVLLDTELEIAVIAKKQKLSSTIIGIANQLSRLLNTSESIQKNNARIEIIPIQDPENFIDYIHKAFNINKFSMTFSLPNPFDANEDFIKPLQKALDHTNGEKGKVEMKGEQLKADTLEEFVRSVASTGDDATIRFKKTDSSSPETKHLREKAVIFSEEEVSSLEQKINIIIKSREIYRKIRGSKK